jgi:multiple sugar transport system permease protein
VHTIVAALSKQRAVPYAFIGPALCGLLIFRVYPIFLALWRSLHQQTLAGSVYYAGNANYLAIVADSHFWHAVRTTFYFNLIINPLQISLALGLALLVNRQSFGVGFFRTAFFLPMTVSIALTSIIWGLILHPQLGLLNAILETLGLPRQPLLIGERQAFWSIIALSSWKGIGYWMVFLLAGLQQIPRSMYEAASLDGASAFQQFVRVTLPLLKRVLAFVFVADTSINFLAFTPVYLLTGGGPNGATELLMFQAYRTAFVFLDLGKSTAISTVILAVILTLTGLQLRLLRTDVEY